jgi:molybdopterin synthase catalytic subunit
MPSNCSAAAARTRAEARPYGDAVELTVDQVPGLGTRDWIAVTERELPAGRALAWASVPDCGAVVSVCGTVRDHSPGRPEVSSLEYEVHPDSAVPRLAEVAAAARRRWPMIGRLALLHRSGPLVVGEVSVVVVASTPHRAEAFDAAEYCIDTLKRTVPIWKRETWSGGSDWSACDHEIEDVGP